MDDTCSRAPEHLELDGGTWKAHGFEVDNLSAVELTAAFARPQPEGWVAETDDGTFGFGHDGACTVTLTLESADGGPPSRVRFEFGAEAEEGVYARAADRPGIFLAPASLRALAGRPAVERGGFRLDVRSLSHVVLSRTGETGGAGATVVLTRPPGAYRLERAGADDDAGDPGEGDKLESALAGLHAEFALHTGPADRAEGLDKPTLAIETDDRTRIVIGAPARDGTTDGYFARVSGIDATFLVPREPVDAIVSAW